VECVNVVLGGIPILVLAPTPAALMTAVFPFPQSAQVVHWLRLASLDDFAVMFAALGVDSVSGHQYITHIQRKREREKERERDDTDAATAR
jgi:hypothetical protein